MIVFARTRLSVWQLRPSLQAMFLLFLLHLLLKDVAPPIPWPAAVSAVCQKTSSLPPTPLPSLFFFPQNAVDRILCPVLKLAGGKLLLCWCEGGCVFFPVKRILCLNDVSSY